MAASFPGSAKVFTTKVDGVDDVMASHINDLQLEVAALETQLLTTSTWVPTFTGFSADPVNGIYQYQTIGDHVFLTICQPNNGTSNATGFTITLPFTAKTITGMAWVGFAKAVDNGSSTTSPATAIINSAGTTMTLYKDAAGTLWTNSGGKRCVTLQMWYQKA